MCSAAASTGMPTRTQSDIISCAYASHGDTKHVLLFPEDPYECFEMAAQCLDLADRLQTPIFLMTDLDIGMNQRLCKPLTWSDERRYDRGKVLSREDLEAGKEFARYKDLDGDGIPYRTYPGTHETKGAYFTRGTSRNPQAIYSEAGPTTSTTCSAFRRSSNSRRRWCRSRSSRPRASRPASARSTTARPARRCTRRSSLSLLRTFSSMPCASGPSRSRRKSTTSSSRLKVFVIEQNRDAQLKTLMVNDAGINPASLISILHYDGTPITARFITQEIAEIVAALNVRPIKKDKAA